MSKIPCRSRAFAERSPAKARKHSICNCLQQSLLAKDLVTSEQSSWSKKKQKWAFPTICLSERILVSLPASGQLHLDSRTLKTAHAESANRITNCILGPTSKLRRLMGPGSLNGGMFVTPASVGRAIPIIPQRRKGCWQGPGVAWRGMMWSWLLVPCNDGRDDGSWSHPWGI